MKRFKAVYFTLNPNMRKQIDQEVNILKLIGHENLVKFFELLVVKSEEHFEQRFLFILTEYYEVSNFYLIFLNKCHSLHLFTFTVDISPLTFLQFLTNFYKNINI